MSTIVPDQSSWQSDCYQQSSQGGAAKARLSVTGCEAGVDMAFRGGQCRRADAVKDNSAEHGEMDMFGKKWFRKGLILALAVVASDAYASVRQCRGCAPAQMEQLALQQGPGTWDVWNPLNGAISRFKVVCGAQVNAAPSSPASAGTGGDTVSGVASTPPAPAAQCTNRIVDWPPVPPLLVETAANLSMIHNATGGTFKAGIVVRAENLDYPGYDGRTPTAHLYLTDANLRARYNDLLDHDAILTSTNPLAAIYHWAMAHADSALGFTEALELLVTVEFDDGSTVKVVITLTRPAEYVQGSGRDEEGNLLPDANVSTNAGTWRFTAEGNSEAWRRMMLRLGAGGHMLGSGTSPWRTEYWTCDWDQTSNRLTCTRRYAP